MHVTKKHHYGVVSILLAIIIILIGLFVFSDSKLGSKEHYETIPIEEYVSHPQSEHLKAPETPFLTKQEVVIIPETETEEVRIIPIQRVLFEYVEVTKGCGPYMEEECLNVRSSPSTTSPIVHRLRNGAVLKIGGIVENDDEVWYKITFDEWLRYPERVTDDWYINAEYVEILLDEGDKTIWDTSYATNTKKIIIDCSDQTLYAYEGEKLIFEESISTGLKITPTPKGTFSIFKKTPSRYMQGPIWGVSTKYYDLPGVPWNLYFTHGGAVIHGTYWHDKFGAPYSNGCVNLPPDRARELYYWATLGTTVIVQD